MHYVLDTMNDTSSGFWLYSIFYFATIPTVLLQLIATVIWPKKLWIAHFLIITFMARCSLFFLDLNEERNKNDGQTNAVHFTF